MHTTYLLITVGTLKKIDLDCVKVDSIVDCDDIDNVGVGVDDDGFGSFVVIIACVELSTSPVTRQQPCAVICTIIDNS
jgi:hypothetical protein